MKPFHYPPDFAMCWYAAEAVAGTAVVAYILLRRAVFYFACITTGEAPPMALITAGAAVCFGVFCSQLSDAVAKAKAGCWEFWVLVAVNTVLAGLMAAGWAGFALAWLDCFRRRR